MANFSLLPLTLAVAAGLIFSAPAKAQNSNVTNPYSNPNGGAADPFSGAPGMGAGSTSHPGKSSGSDSSEGDSSDVDDPTLYRMKTKDSVASGAMSRDDGELTRRLKKPEKVLNVESTKQLPTSKPDPKFEGSLLQSSVGSIRDVGAKTHLELQTKGDGSETENAEPPIKDEGEARFKARRLMLNPSTEEQTKKTESPRTKADSSSSPSPSPSASVTPSSRR